MDGEKIPRFLLIGLAYLGFISLGLPDGLLGIAWPSIRASFTLPIDALGAMLVMFTVGYLVSSFGSGRMLARIGVGTLLALSCLATSLSLIGYALAPAWWAMLALAVLSGIGAGAIDAGLNTYAATEFTPRVVNWLHACYGIGATTGPVVMTGVLMSGRSWQSGYAIVGLWQLLLAACFAVTRKRWHSTKKNKPEHEPEESSARAGIMPARATLRLRAAWLSIAVFFVYTGIEASAGAWAYTLLTESRGIEMGAAGIWVSAYWGGLMAGRMLAGAIINYGPVERLLRFAILGVAAGALLVWLNAADAITLVGLVLIGVALAPIFPTLIATTPARLGPRHTANAVGFQIAAAVLGASLVPAAVGMLAGSLGLEAIAPSLFVAAALLLSLYEMLMLASARRARIDVEMISRETKTI
jgi:fucose permease